ncbi:hypothetical protein BCR39DRAFT_65544 [Naematelia encephala]|uniref:Ribonuclease H1 N-terminal domain-containing protein n=1 Tax=Naematelia encephala TaxID=71784 RepID=A0A1Y2AFQ5_9TREE|nr:hypothetical protein BCR39DRAFT_65544 [Naematelia encephala]
MSAFLANLETIDKPLSSTHSSEAEYRISRLPPAPSVPDAGPSSGHQRYLFVAVRKGHRPGVYTCWDLAEQQVINHPAPVFKTFSTRLAAEAFVAGWDGAGRHSLPGSSPKPLREHLAMNFPSSVPYPSPSPASSMPRRASYHTRLLMPDSATWSDFDPRPTLKHSSTSYRTSMVRISSPLRQQVDEEPRPRMRKAHSMIGFGGLLSPPQSPQEDRQGVMDRERPNKPRIATEAGLWASSQHRRFPAISSTLGLLSPPSSPPTTTTTTTGRPGLSVLGGGSSSRTSSAGSSRTPSGLWADAIPSSPSPLSPPPDIPIISLPPSSAPKFSRAGLKKSGIILPASAPKTKTSSSSLRPSRNSFLSPTTTSSRTSSISPSGSTTSLTSDSNSTHTVHRLESLAETSRRELQLNDEGLLALSSLAPPRPAFMRRQPSNSSISSEASVGSMTSGSSAPSTTAIAEQETDGDGEGEGEDEVVQISCTRSDGDADGSVESSSVKSGKGFGKAKKGGGLFKRLGKAIGLEKKTVPGQDAGRRGSV